jgi:hypothetical protein
MNLLTEKQFRKEVITRDNNKCVVCKTSAIFDSNGEVSNLSVQHIIERKLWSDGGYYIDNGVTLCESCRIKSEQTLISCNELRKFAGIKNVIYPEQYYTDQDLDKWGNIILPNGNRLRGELFYEDYVQKALQPVLHLFKDYVKYPRTYHVPWSPGGKDKNERVLNDLSHFHGKEVVVTEKLDGENITIYRDYIHARSLEPLDSHPSRTRIKAFHSQIKNDLPKGFRFCMENVFAKHSIHYKHLKDYHYLISVWDEKNNCLSWSETVEWANLLEIPTVPVLYYGIYDENLIKNLYKPLSDNGDECEGYVLRIADKFPYRDFRKFNLKFVRENHVTSNSHWKYSKMIQNKLDNDIKI